MFLPFSGITPACAGKSGLQGSSRLLRGDHPRMCGEKGLSTFWSRNHSGSPPRMRGKVRAQCVQRDCVGITPAYAGKSRTPARCRSSPGDHPRVCGEKSATYSPFSHKIGSPPHVRGKDAVKRHSARGFGITPAYAGKSRGCPAACILRRDHPRVCGEKALLCLSLQQILGSPPRMRGKAFPSIKTILLMRITPAYAGKSC